MKFLEACAQSYLNAQHWSARRQIRSLMAEKLSLNELREFFLTVTSYRYNIARLHSLFYGRAAPVYLVMRPEECELSPQRLDFIYYESSRIFRICLLAKSS